MGAGSPSCSSTYDNSLMASRKTAFDHESGGPLPSKRTSPRSSGLSLGRSNATTNDELFGEEVDPIHLHTDRELQKEVDSIAFALRDLISTDWSERIAAMKRLQGIMLAGVGHIDSAYSIINKLREPLCAQLQDLRSAITRDACKTVVMMAQSLQDRFEPFMEPFLIVLFKLTFVAIAVIAESANVCIKTMLEHCQCARAIPKIIECTTSRNNVQRTRAIQYILQILQTYQLSTMDRFADAFEDCIKVCLADSQSDVRAVARQCFWSFSQIWEERAARLFNRLDSQTQKHIADEATKLGIDSSFLSSSIVTSYGSGSSSARNAKFTSGPARVAVSALSQTHPPVQHQHASIAKQGSTVEGRLATVGGTVQHSSLPASGRSSTQPPVSPPGLRTSATTDSLTDRQREELANALPGSSLYNGSQRPTTAPVGGARRIATAVPRKVEAAPESIRGGFVDGIDSSVLDGGNMNVGSLGGAKRVPKSLTPATQPVAVAHSLPKGGARRVLKDQPKEKENIDVLPSRPMHTTLGEVGAVQPSTKLSKPQKTYDETYDDENEDAYFTGPSTESVGLHSARQTDDDMSQIVVKADSQSWSTRVDCFTELKSFYHSLYQKVSKSNSAASSQPVPFPYGPTVADRLMNLHFKHMGDSHYKVCAASMDSAAELISCFAESFENQVEKLLPKILPKLSDPKEQPRQAAVLLLEAMESHISAELMIPVAVRVVEQNSLKLKIATLDFMARIILRSGNYFNNANAARVLVQRLVPMLNDRSMDLKRAVSSCLLAMREKNTVSFLTQVSVLSGTQQMLLKENLSSKLPELEGELANFIRQRKSGAALPRGSSMNSVSSNGSVRDLTLQHSEEEPETVLPSPDGQRIPIVRGLIPLDASNGRISIPDSPLLSSLVGSHHLPSVQELAPLQSNSSGSIPSGEHSRGPTPPLPFADKPTSAFRAKVADHRRLSSSPILGEPAAAFYPVQTFVPCSISELLSEPNRLSALKQLLKLVTFGSIDEVAWRREWGDLRALVLNGLKDREALVREQSVMTLREIISRRPQDVSGHVEQVMNELLNCYRDTNRQVCQAADDALDELVATQNAASCMDILQPLVLREDSPVLQVIIKLIARLLPRVGATMYEYLDAVMPGLVEAFKHPNADVRKSVVFCLVDLYGVLGDSLMPHLQSLNTSQMKLVTIYINRAQKSTSPPNVA
eukprot:GILK01009041.1.p1 GENE.GILK01009041.1~~GILK01009041.1.p1  ORF type:complete len:1198 (-),score=196.76 GILK01009041.1:274-3867(-)